MQRVGLRSSSAANTTAQKENGLGGKATLGARPLTRAALGDVDANRAGAANPAGDVKKTGYGAQGKSRLARPPLKGAENAAPAERKSSIFTSKGSLLARPAPAKPLTRQVASAALRPAAKTPEDVEMPSPGKASPMAEDVDVSASEITDDRGSAHSYSAAMIPDIDEGDEDDPQMVAAYAVDIFKYLKAFEKQQAVSTDFLHAKVVTPRMRSILVDWLHQVHNRFHLLPETIYLTVQIIDRFLDASAVAKDKLQLVGVTGMLIASKYEEMYAPEVNDFVYITDDTYTAKQILTMERKMLSTLGCSLGRPLPIHFLRRFSKAAEADYIIHTMSKYLMELATCDYALASVLPSVLAGAALLLTLTLLQAESTGAAGAGLWSATLAHYSGLRDEELRPTLRLLAKLLVKVTDGKSKLQAVRAKFSAAKFHAISAHKALDLGVLKALSE